MVEYALPKRCKEGVNAVVVTLRTECRRMPRGVSKSSMGSWGKKHVFIAWVESSSPGLNSSVPNT